MVRHSAELTFNKTQLTLWRKIHILKQCWSVNEKLCLCELKQRLNYKKFSFILTYKNPIQYNCIENRRHFIANYNFFQFNESGLVDIVHVAFP